MAEEKKGYFSLKSSQPEITKLTKEISYLTKVLTKTSDTFKESAKDYKKSKVTKAKDFVRKNDPKDPQKEANKELAEIKDLMGENVSLQKKRHKSFGSLKMLAGAGGLMAWLLWGERKSLIQLGKGISGLVKGMGSGLFQYLFTGKGAGIEKMKSSLKDFQNNLPDFGEAAKKLKTLYSVASMGGGLVYGLLTGNFDSLTNSFKSLKDQYGVGGMVKGGLIGAMLFGPTRGILMGLSGQITSALIGGIKGLGGPISNSFAAAFKAMANNPMVATQMGGVIASAIGTGIVLTKLVKIAIDASKSGKDASEVGKGVTKSMVASGNIRAGALQKHGGLSKAEANELQQLEEVQGLMGEYTGALNTMGTAFDSRIGDRYKTRKKLLASGVIPKKILKKHRHMFKFGDDEGYDMKSIMDEYKPIALARQKELISKGVVKTEQLGTHGDYVSDVTAQKNQLGSIKNSNKKTNTDNSIRSYFLNGATLEGLQDVTYSNFMGLADEYYNTFGEPVQVNSGYRTLAEQKKLHKDSPKKAAREGRSFHNYGYALDIQSDQVAKMNSKGMLKRHNFYKPIGEPWHIEDISTGPNRYTTMDRMYTRRFKKSPGKLDLNTDSPQKGDSPIRESGTNLPKVNMPRAVRNVNNDGIKLHKESIAQIVDGIGQKYKDVQPKYKSASTFQSVQVRV